MSKKIVNDPVYGFISIPYGIIFDLIEHPYFQRLRRIKQVSLTHYVYPGALHTRFHHALGAFHLMTQAIEVLRSKGVNISDEEATAVSIAILLHDIGHGPFSHTLEHTLLEVRHETLSALFMEKLNEEFGGQLDLAVAIFEDRYEKKFLHQLVSGQLDMDRMDYLSRDSFFTGVYEGVIGYDRIIKMLSVHDGALVVEEKGIYSIEKFLIARRLMYWQVYLHKTVLVAEQMLVQILRRARSLIQQGVALPASAPLTYFLKNHAKVADFKVKGDLLLQNFALLDDFDIIAAVKNWMLADDPLLAYFSRGLINRRLFRIEMRQSPFPKKHIEAVRQRLLNSGQFQDDQLEYLVFKGKESNSAYTAYKDEIKILFKNGKVKPMSVSTDYGMQSKVVTKYYLCYPKGV
jgi:HD superfamily phosphohydrolase